nr:hypothetical protein [Tanacetum cinerariifolium]
MAKTNENTTNPQQVPPTPQASHTLSTIKLLILKKDEYDIWALKMEHYLEHTDYPIWEVIQKGNGPVQKGYDRFQSLLRQLETHDAVVSTEDSNQKFLRSLPSFWSQVSLIIRTKPGVDTLNFDDLYNNLRVFESDFKGSTGSSSSTQNVAFVSSDNTGSTNEVNTAYDLKHVDEFDLEEMDLKWRVAMISTRLEKFYKKTGRKLHFDAKEPVGFDKSKVKCFNCHNTGHFARECRSNGNQDSVYWTGHAEDDTEDYALMAFNSSSDTKVTSCSKVCEESYAKLKKLYDEQREQLGVASIEIQAYTLAFKKGNYMPPKSDFGIDESNSTYGPKQSTIHESDAKTSS